MPPAVPPAGAAVAAAPPPPPPTEAAAAWWGVRGGGNPPQFCELEKESDAPKDNDEDADDDEVPLEDAVPADDEELIGWEGEATKPLATWPRPPLPCGAPCPLFDGGVLDKLPEGKEIDPEDELSVVAAPLECATR